MAKTQITTAAEAASLVKDGMTVMVGGFMANGTPEPIIDELVKSNVKDLTIICNDAGFGRKKDKETGEWKGKASGVGKLVENGQVKKLIASHVGLNPEFGAKYFEGEIDLELVPQGTLAERIRCGGSGLGGFYTPTGVGTEVAEGKEIKTIDGVDYILELPLHADIALIGGHKADASGNLRYIGSERNFNPMMAMAADTVVAGRLSCRRSRIMGDIKNFIASRVAKELKDGDVVNLGIGLPTLVPNHLPEGVDLTLQSENGFVGLVPLEEGKESPHVVNAGGVMAGIADDGAFFSSADSFAIIRGGHVDVTVLGSLQVDEKGNIANYKIPGKMLPGMGGAMDLVVGARKVIVAMEHTNKGKHKILKECTLPLTAKGQVNLIVTEMGVMKVTPEGLALVEYNPEYTIEEIQAATEAELIIADDLKEMAV